MIGWLVAFVAVVITVVQPFRAAAPVVQPFRAVTFVVQPFRAAAFVVQPFRAVAPVVQPFRAVSPVVQPFRAVTVDTLPRVVIETEAGDIEIEVDIVRAPDTAANFLKYVDGGFYNGGRFHRTVKPDNQPNNVVKIEVIQAGASAARTRDYFSPIPLQRTSVTRLTHADGTVSMARSELDTARDQFFICIGNQPELDFGGKRNSDGQGFAAFGRVVRGMDVVRRIQAAPAEAQNLTPPVRIIRARRL
jgi:peptidyl-prolyl cis-trans isomerase A (cyclophilin A)